MRGAALARRAPDTTAMPCLRSALRTCSLTASLTACGLMKRKAWFTANLGVSSNGSPPSFCAFLSIAGTERSSMASKSDTEAPSHSTCGSLAHASSVSFLTPASMIAAAVSSSSIDAASQFSRSTSASSGLALPCTAFRPMFGRSASPSSSQLSSTSLRSEPARAADGSVAPSTLERNSSHDSDAAFHCTE